MNHHDTNTVRVSRNELLKILVDNKAKHVKEFELAIVQWRKDRAAELLTASVAVANGRVTGAVFEHGVVPQSYEQDYVRAITKFSLSVDETILLNDNQFNQYVLDQWTFSAMSLLNSTYATKALS